MVGFNTSTHSLGVRGHDLLWIILAILSLLFVHLRHSTTFFVLTMSDIFGGFFQAILVLLDGQNTCL